MPNENENRPADVAQADSVGGMARRLANPAHLADLARRSAATLREQGAEQLWRDVTFRVGLAFPPRFLAAPRRYPAAPRAESPARGQPAGAQNQRRCAGVQHAAAVL